MGLGILTNLVSGPADQFSFIIKSEGKPVGDNYHLTSISVVREVNRIPTARVMVTDSAEGVQPFAASDGKDFITGKSIEILMGYGGNEETVFKGVVTKHGLKVRQKKPPVLCLELKDEAMKMCVGRKNKYFNNLTDSAIISKILGEYSLTGVVSPTTLSHPEMVQYYCTDWDFVLSRAEKNGLVLIADDGKVNVEKPDLKKLPEMIISQSDIYEFDSEMEARFQYKDVEANAWDFSSQDVVSAKGKEPLFITNGNVTSNDLSKVVGLDSYAMNHSGAVSNKELEAWASAKVLKSRLAKTRGRIKMQGFAGVRPGQVVTLTEVGQRFNGNVYVSGVSQQLTGAGWETDIQFGLSEKWFTCEDDIIDTPAAGLLPAVGGLQIGVVSKLGPDPDGEDRIQVKMPLVDNTNDGVWARMASPDAGENRGILFRPEVNDEVILGFINDDPRNPIILGTLHSSSKPAPLEANDDNFEKGIITKGEMKVIFNDEALSLTIITPNENTITLSDEEGAITIKDENGNSIAMTSDGITIESGGDLNLNASGDVNVKGVNVALSADASITVEGGSGAELSSGGSTAISGALVEIN